MSLPESVKKFWHWTVKLKEAIGLIIFYIALIYTPTNPDIEVVYSEFDYFSDPVKESNSNNLNSLITIILDNKAERDIEDVQLVINDVININSIYGRSSLKSINDDISNLVNFELEKNKITFNHLNRIPAGHNIQIQMHGEFYHNNFLSNRIDFFANSNKIVFTKKHLTTGFSYHIDKYKNVYFAFSIILLIWIGFTRFERDDIK